MYSSFKYIDKLKMKVLTDSEMKVLSHFDKMNKIYSRIYVRAAAESEKMVPIYTCSNLTS